MNFTRTVKGFIFLRPKLPRWMRTKYVSTRISQIPLPKRWHRAITWPLIQYVSACEGQIGVRVIELTLGILFLGFLNWVFSAQPIDEQDLERRMTKVTTPFRT